jgi:4-hydroxyphenylpyruvate dioxygenase
LRVKDAAYAYKRALSLGARPHHGEIGPMELAIPAIKGIGDSAIYLVDRYGKRSIYDVDFVEVAGAPAQPDGVGLKYIDHLTHNVERGRMQVWAEFYERIFGFREIRYFDIEGQQTGVRSKAMTSPCGLIRIPINEEGNERAGQIQEYLDAYHGEGIQHIALSARDLCSSVDALRQRGVGLLDTPDTYYELIDRRIPDHGQSVAALRERKILIDGTPSELLLQIFSENVLGPIFFEFIERRGNQGFGEGNFKALFESIELDQVRRGVLPQAGKKP